MLGQDLVNKIMQCDDTDAVVVPPRSKEDDERDAWALRYIACMVARGVPLNDAAECYSNGDHDYTSDPEYAAETEMSYWDDDGDA